MSASEHVLNTGAHSDYINTPADPVRAWSSTSTSSYRVPMSYWGRLIEPSVLVPFIVLLASVCLSANILDVATATINAIVPDAVRQSLWDAIVSVLPASLIFTIDDLLAPFPSIRQPFDILDSAALHEAKSSALARSLGVCPGGRRFNPSNKNDSSTSTSSGGSVGGLFASVTHAGKTGFSRLMPKGDIDRPAGLGNISNSCYQNSVLQALSALEPLRHYLCKVADEETAGYLKQVETSRTLDDLVRILSTATRNGETLWTPPILKRMSTFQQQDAQEYFCKLLSEIEEEVEKAIKTVRSKSNLASDLSLSLGVQPPSVLSPCLPECDAVGRSRSCRTGSDSEYSDDSGYHSAATSASSLAASLASSFRIPLEGLLAQRIVCQTCGYSSGLSMSPFYSLTVNPDVGSAEIYLEETLDNFTAVETIEGVQCASCTLIKVRRLIKILIARAEENDAKSGEEDQLKQKPGVNLTLPMERLAAVEAALEDEDFEEKSLSEKCKVPEKQRVQSTKSRQVGIARAPQSIAFHINRSRFDERTGYTFKNPAAICFPLHLDLGPWCLGSAAASLAPASAAGDEEATSLKLPDQERDNAEQWQLPAQLPMVSGSQHNPRLEGPYYELRAVITHYGQHENGHYVCYRKHPIVKEEQPAKVPGVDAAIDVVADEDMSDANSSSERALADDEKTICAPLEAPTDDEKTIVNDSSTTGDGGRETATESAGPRPEEKEYESQWWRLSDQNVSRSDEATVLSQGGVFMLFYDRIDARSTLRPSGKIGSQKFHQSALGKEDELLSHLSPESILAKDDSDGDRCSGSVEASVYKELNRDSATASGLSSSLQPPDKGLASAGTFDTVDYAKPVTAAEA
ncbi:ubiquitin-specific protease ubp1 [Sporothrix epigloea]|uniref:ubiquitinyl hydrolase 1 n=1 Tax=Sporothrix epigloea TaxID=1892477 RepID=A0ABP0E157_9PEZI